MSYVVLARKWRPQTFEDLTGQEHVAQTLRNALERDRVPHAMLFTGARGVGKTSSARIMAMSLNCANGPTIRPCGQCSSCVEIQRSQSVDVLEIDGASNRGINEIRELRDSVRYAPQRDRYKVYIIDEVHMLTNEAFNALLKTLEEPPPHVVFLFATTEAHKIPVTILSRCQRFDFRRITQDRLCERLRHIVDAEGIRITDEVLGLIARQAAGGMRDALSLLDQVIAFAGTDIDTETATGILGVAERRQLFELTDAIFAQDIDRALACTDEVLSFGVDLTWFVAELVGHLRDLAVVAVARSPRTATTLTEDELLRARAQTERTDAATIHRAFEIVVETAESIVRSNHGRMLFDMALVRIASLERTHSFRSLVQQLDALSRGERLPSATVASDGPPVSTEAARSVSPVTSAGARGKESARVSTEAAAPPGSEPESEPEPEPEPKPQPKPQPEPEPKPARPSAASPTTTPAAPDRFVPEAAHASVPKEEAEPPSEPRPPTRPGASPGDAVKSEPGLERASTGVSFEGRWRDTVRVLVEGSPLVGAFVRTASVREDGEVLEMVLSSASRAFWRAEHEETIREAIHACLGMQLRVDEHGVNDDESAPDWLNLERLDQQRATEERRRRDQAIESHASTRAVRSAWPDARIEWTFRETSTQDEEQEG